MVGDSVTLTCLVILSEGVSHDVNFEWEGPGETHNPTSLSTIGQEVTSELTLSAIRTYQAGEYTCTASLSGFRVSSRASTNITVQSKLYSHLNIGSSFLHSATMFYSSTHTIESK